jgi:hypothetical protein
MSNIEIESLGMGKGHSDDDKYKSDNQIRRIPPYTVGNDEGPLLWPRGGLQFIERKDWKDPYKIELIRPPLAKNLCFFVSCLNVLGTEEERKAFCCGDLDDPSKTFEALFPQVDGDDGYSGSDILQYLKYLKAEGHVKAFEWSVYTNFRWPNIVLTKPFPIDTTLVFDCTSSCKDLVTETQTKLTAVEFKNDPKGPDTQAVFSKSNGYKRNRKMVKGRRRAKDSKVYITESIQPSLKVANQDKYHKKDLLHHRHAIGIRFVPWYGSHAPTMDSVKDGNGTPVIFDNRWEDSRQVLPGDLASVYNVRKMYQFKLHL